MTLSDDRYMEQSWGDRLRLWREDVKHWSRAELRDHIEAMSYKLKEQRGHLLDVRLIARWESGQVQRPQPVYLRILTSIGAPLPVAPGGGEEEHGELAAPIVLCLDVDPADPSGDQADIGVAAVISELTQRDLSVNRRELVKLFASTFVGGALLGHVERILGGVTKGPQVVAGRARSVGYDEVSQIETAARLFREWDDQFGGGLRRKAVIGQLNEVAELVSEPHPAEINRRLTGVMAELAETAAMMSWDSGHDALAQRYYLTALQAARVAGDLPFAANILAGMARQSLYNGNAGDALELVRLAQTSAGNRATYAVHSMLYTREAWAYAALGRPETFRRATAMAEDALAAAEPDSDPHWIRYYDAAELNGTIGGRLLELAVTDKRFASDAIVRISDAIALRRPSRFRSSALDELGLAECYILQGDLDEAARLGHAAVDKTAQTASDRVRVQLMGLSRRASVYGHVPVIHELQDRMKALLNA